MSKPNKYYYSVAKKLIMLSRDLPEDKLIPAMVKLAMKDTNQETLKLPDGELRMRAVDDVLIKQLYTIDGEAYRIGYSERTVQGWISSYVNLFGHNLGL